MVAISDNRNDYVTVVCVHCGDMYTMFYNREDMVDWLSGSLPIQDAMPYLTANERELLLSGTCGHCFDEMFSMLDNDE